MADKNDILSRKIRERLKDFEQPVSDRIWNNIEEELYPIVNISKTKILWKRLSFAASFLLIVALGTLFFVNQKNTDNNQSDNNVIKQEISAEKTFFAASDNDQSIIDSDNSVHQANPKSLFKPKNNTGTKKISKPVDEIRIAEKVFSSQNQTASSSENKDQKENFESAQSSKNIDSKTSTFYSDATKNDNLWHDSSGKKKKKGGISYALALGNSGNFRSGGDHFGDSYGKDFSKSTLNSYMGFPLVSVDLSSQSVAYQSENTRSANFMDYDHDFPISVGLTARKDVSECFALESGLIYTYLASKGTSKVSGPVVTNNIQLHYLGIPLKAVYSLYKNYRFSAYASAGGMIEKSISGSENFKVNGISETKNLDIKRIQCSLIGSIGINYRLVGHLGLFLEPGIGYYFDDGSSIETIRKDQPLSFTMQGGVRLSY